MTEDKFNKQHTLCWDCAKATGYCSWSSILEPVKGWTAYPTKANTYESYRVTECPEFVRDAYNCGMKRYKDEEN